MSFRRLYFQGYIPDLLRRMNAEIMELFIDFSGVAMDDYTKLWCGEGEGGICIMQKMFSHRREAREIGTKDVSSNRGKTADSDIGKLLIKSDTKGHFSTNQHF